MIKYSIVLSLVFVFLFQNIKAQSNIDSIQLEKEFVNLDEALKSPRNVYRLDLSNQDVQFSDIEWSSFTNLEYLSLKNDHLKQIPTGLGSLKNLKVLDLSGNDFEVLPSSFSNLTNLEELFLNDDKNLDFEKNIPILSTLPNLRSLHVENDGLKSLPQNIFQLSRLESLYLNNNKFKEFPKELSSLKQLQYTDMKGNKFKLPQQDVPQKDFGLRIRF